MYKKSTFALPKNEQNSLILNNSDRKTTKPYNSFFGFKSKNLDSSKMAQTR